MSCEHTGNHARRLQQLLMPVVLRLPVGGRYDGCVVAGTGRVGFGVSPNRIMKDSLVAIATPAGPTTFVGFYIAGNHTAPQAVRQHQHSSCECSTSRLQTDSHIQFVWRNSHRLRCVLASQNDPGFSFQSLSWTQANGYTTLSFVRPLVHPTVPGYTINATGLTNMVVAVGASNTFPQHHSSRAVRAGTPVL